MRCPKCGATLKYKARILKGKHRKRCEKVIRSLVCSTCDYVKPRLEVRAC